MHRTIIEAAADGNTLITLERNNKLGGNARQRRQQRKREMDGKGPVEWYRMARKIVRGVVSEALPVKFDASTADITLLPLGSTETIVQSIQNAQAAAAYRDEAEVMATTIDLHNSFFEVKPAKKRKMVWADEDDHVEVSQPEPLEYL